MTGMQWTDVVLVIGALGLVAFVCLNAFVAARVLREGDLPFNLLLHPVEVVARFGFVAICLLLAWLSGLSPEQLGLWGEGVLANVAIGVAVGLLLQEANHRSTKWAVATFGAGIYRRELLCNILPTERREWVLALLAFFPAALAEELLFRVLAIGAFSVWVNPLLLAVVFSGIFGLAHWPQGKLGVVGAGVLGLTLNLLFIWRWSVVACTAAHYVVNVAQLLRAPAELRWLDSLAAE